MADRFTLEKDKARCYVVVDNEAWDGPGQRKYNMNNSDDAQSVVDMLNNFANKAEADEVAELDFTDR